MTIQPGRPMSEIRGRLEAYVAGPGRAIIWSIHEFTRPDPGGVHPLLNGDFLTVYGPGGAVSWSGIVDLDFEICQAPDPDDPTSMAQMVLGRRVHGVQKYVAPEKWAQMFLEGRKAQVQRLRTSLP